MASEASRSASVDKRVFTGPRWSAPIALFGLAVVLFLMRLHTYREPLESDLTTYAVIAHEMLKGRPLYVDLWDIKPPLIFWTYAGAELVAGYGSRSVFLLNILAALITLLGSYFSARELSGRRLGGLLAAGFWTLISGDLVLQGNQPNAEVFINAALVWGLYFTAVALRKEPAQRRGALACAGTCFAVASLYKQVALVVPLALAVVLVCTLFRGQGLKRKLTPFVLLLLPAVLAWGLTAAYFVKQGSFAEFYQTLVDMGQAYAQDQSVAASPEWRTFLPRTAWFLIPLLVLPVLGAILGKERRTQWALVWAYLAMVPLAVALPNKYFPHYFQLYLPIAAIAGAVGIAELSRGAHSRPARAALPLAIAALLWLGWREVPFYRLPADEWCRLKYGSFYFDILDLNTKVSGILKPDEQLYEYGAESGFYFYGQRTPPSGMLGNFGLLQGPYKLQYTRQVILQLDKAAPEMVIVAKYMARGPVTDWISVRYSMIGQTDTFVVLAKRGGKLEQRLAKQ